MLTEGLIIRAQSGFFEIETDHGRVTSQLRGKLKRGRRRGDAAALGDRVTVRVLEDGTGSIEQVLPRKSVLSRKAPGRQMEQVIVANPDQALFVFACADPDPNLHLLDRLLVVAERDEIPARVCLNKLDLVYPSDARRVFSLYERLGYPVLYVSAKTGKGLGELRRALRGRLSVLAGPSGVGKTTLLNRLLPGAGLRTAEVSRATGKGLHTTVVPELLPLKGGGYVADTPGLKAFDLWDIEPVELDAYFCEMRPLVEQCAFSDCTHLHEPGCAVLEAVAQGKMDTARYESYVRMRLGETE